ncbi:hypothetical protein AAZX31_15G151500 [Glycine max]|uniref:Uncharacterized protein n=2 Tax=Glycine subgen. Soja TaxID=1462606 RepID=A0A0R0G1X5_SOYBN|nr:hypothetical protein JHK87_042413 [Glycine soja]KAG4956758.1 hypothetical protein JHK85_043138 [Glycine max]KAG5105502.1 hypothetical protein JHK82_042472 [Glycine max]KAG5116617.1 hypothetical protein JHK84_042730 [Glycine max]KAH1147389.1 hypothetical protein GYH30_042517 [Glycine max]
MEVAQLLQAPVVRRVQLQREFFIPRTDDLVKAGIRILKGPIFEAYIYEWEWEWN